METTSNPTPSEFDLDPFRGLVCLWLMALHFCWLSEAHAALLRLTGPDPADIFFHVRLGVESFLVLAGFMMAHMLRPVPGEAVRFGAYFRRRAYRLLLPFGAAILLAAADRWVAHLVFGGGHDRPDLTAILTQLLLVNEYFGIPEPAVGYWSMATLEQFYLLWLVALAIARWAAPGDPVTAYGRAVAHLGPIALIVFAVSGSVFLGVGSIDWQVPKVSFYIAFGILLYGCRCLGLYRWEFRAALVGMAAAAIGFQQSRLTAALIAAGLLYALASGAKFPRGPAFAVLRFVGKRAYSVYLIHAVIGMRVLTGFRYVAEFGDWVAVPLIVLAAVLSLAGAALFYDLIEAPCQSLARRVRYRVMVPDSPASEAPTPMRLVAARCCICDLDVADPVGQGLDFEYGTCPDTFFAVRCRQCRVIYLNPRPHDDELSRIYPSTYHAFDFSPAHFGFVYRVRRWLEARRLLDYARGSPAEARVLDVGCGDGFHLQILRDFGPRGWVLEGLDASERAVEAARSSGLNVSHGRLAELHLPEQSYDLVLLIQTIEHLADPTRALEAIRRLLKPSGTLVVVTDNVRSFDFRLFRRRHWGGYHFPRHWTLFDRDTIGKLAAKAGLEVESVTTIVSPVNWVYSIRNWLQDRGAPKFVYERFRLKSPVALAAFTLLDRVFQPFGRGALLCARLRPQ